MVHRGKLPRAVVGEMMHVINNALAIIYANAEGEGHANAEVMRGAKAIKEYVQSFDEKEHWDSNPFETLNLTEAFKQQLHDMSYFNAAESDWASETKARNECESKLKVTAKRLMELGVDPDGIVRAGNYLVSKSDWWPQ